MACGYGAGINAEQPGPGPDAARAEDVVDVAYRGLVDWDGGEYSDVCACRGDDRAGDELVAGDVDGDAGELDRAGADGAEWARGGEVWDSVPGVDAGEL